MIAPTRCPHCGGSLPAPMPGPDPGDPGDQPGPLAGLDSPESLLRPDPIAAAALAPSDDDHRHPPAGAGSWPSEGPLGIDLGGPSIPDRSAGSPALAPGAPRLADVHGHSGEHPSDDDHPAHRSAWPMALLASYASAMTLACGWLWWNGHRGGPSGPPPTWAAGLTACEVSGPGESADPGRRSDASAAVEPLEPIAEGRLIPLGEPSRIEALEITPLGVEIGPVELRRTRVDGRAERRDGGTGALRLRLLLRNTSDDLVFAPLDEAFVREPERRLPEAFVQDDSGTRAYAYRLPVSSEWEIAGQSFRALRPGEAIETIVLSDPETTSLLDGRLTWRLRLRTAPESSAVVGIAFDRGDVEPIR